MTNTTNYNLKKPDMSDRALIGDINDNMDIIDEALGAVASEIEDARGTYSTLDDRMDAQDASIAENENNILKDEAALVELVDNGAKNFINIRFTSKSATATTPSIGNNGDGSITLNGSNTGNNPIIVRDICSDLVASQDTRYTLPTGVYELCGTGNEDVVLQVYMHDGTSANLTQLAQASTSNVVEFTYSNELKATYPYVCFRLYIKAPTTSHEVSFNNLKIEPMVCTKAAWNISPAHQPFRPSYQELYDDVENIYGAKYIIENGDDLNNCTKLGTYRKESSFSQGQVLNCPVTTGFRLEVSMTNGNSRYMQILYPSTQDGIFYMRKYTSNGWGSWYKFEGTAVT